MEKSCRKCALKASSRPVFYFGKQPKTAIDARNYFKNRVRALLKTFKKINFIFCFKPSPF